MKKIIGLFLVAAIGVAIVGCGSQTEGDNAAPATTGSTTTPGGAKTDVPPVKSSGAATATTPGSTAPAGTTAPAATTGGAKKMGKSGG